LVPEAAQSARLVRPERARGPGRPQLEMEPSNTPPPTPQLPKKAPPPVASSMPSLPRKAPPLGAPAASSARPNLKVPPMQHPGFARPAASVPMGTASEAPRSSMPPPPASPPPRSAGSSGAAAAATTESAVHA
jgi:preprotein translocase subunit SecD